MWNIITLDTHLANQIAAGEVVERPVSIVKECVENSIDAGATDIKVSLFCWGIEEIAITDNGSGIVKQDLVKATQKYTTSKIASLDDLHNVLTFWFRWEALASMASVSRLTLISKPRDQSQAYSVTLEEGYAHEPESIAFENGTRVIISDLFYNTPARLNYLKKPRTEYGHILNLLQQLSLVYPEIALSCEHDNTSVLQLPANQDLKTRIYEMYGSEFANNILPLTSEFSGMSITGYISDPKISFPNKNRQLITVNKRVISSPIIYRAIANAYNRFIPHGNFPGYVLNIQLDPTQVDVNVHPRKMEVRFANESTVFRSFFHAVEDALNAVSLQTSPHSNDTDTHSSASQQHQVKGVETPQYYTGSWTKFKSYSPYKDTRPNPAQEAIDFSSQVVRSPSQQLWHHAGIQDQPSDMLSNDLHDTPIGKIIGQFHNSYILVETVTGVQILDQHALAERIIYEKLVKQGGWHSIQGLLVGESLHLTAKELSIFQENEAVFAQMGFEAQILSWNSVLVTSIPDFIKKQDIKEIFLWILNDIRDHNMNQSRSLDEVKNKIFAYASCRSAIKFGHKLNLFEMHALLCDAVVDYSSTCPHGRPVVYDISLDALKDKYER